MSFLGEKISEELTNQVFSKLNMVVKFENIEIGLFPPTSYFKNVKVISKENAPFKLNITASSLGIQFGYLDLFSKNFTIGKISIYDASVKIDTPKDDTDKDFDIKEINKFNFSAFMAFYKKEIYDRMPIRIKGLELEKIDLEIDSKKFFVDNLLVGIYPKRISARGTVENENLIIFSALYPGEQEIDFDFDVFASGAKVKKIKFKNRQDYLGIVGSLTNQGNLLELDGELDFALGIDTLAMAFPQLSAFKSMGGIIYGKSAISKNILDPDLNYSLSILNFTSKYIDLDKIDLEGAKIGSRFLVKTLKGTEGKSSVEIKDSVEFADFSKVDFEKTKIRLIVEEFYSNKILKYVEAVRPIRGFLSGEFDIEVENKNLHFILGENFSCRDFQLQFSETGKPLITNNLIKLSGFKISVLNNDNVEIDGNLNIKNSSLKIQGKVLNKEKSLEFLAKSDPVFDFTELGPISGVDIKGSGKIDLKIAGPTKDVKIDFDAEMNDFGFLGFNIGDVVGKLEYNINKKTLSIFKIESILNNSEIFGSGKLVFGDNSNIDFHIITPHITYQDSLFLYQPLTKDISWLKQKDDFEYLADYKVTGPMDPKKLAVNGYFKGGESVFLGEEVNSFEGKYSYQNQKVQISNFTINNGKGKIFFNANYDIPTSNFSYSTEIEGIRLSDFEFINSLNLGLDGEVVGASKGSKKQGIFKTSSSFNLLSTKIGVEEVSDSKLEIESEGEKIDLNGNLMGEYVILKSYLDLNPSKSAKNSSLDLKIQAKRFPLLLGILSAHNSLNPNLTGELYADLSSSFDFSKPQFLNANLKIRSFNLKNDGDEMAVKKEMNTIDIKNGVIEKWSLAFDSASDYLISKGGGSFNSKYTINNDFKIDLQFLQLLTPNIEQISGNTKGNLIFEGIYPKFDYKLNLGVDLGKLKLRTVPGLFEDFQIGVTQNKSLFSINRFKGKYGKGDVNIGGNIKFEGKEPQLNLNYELSSIRYGFLKKSSANFSGNGFLRGESKPYILNGTFLLGNADIKDSISDLTQGQGTNINYNRWLPKKINTREGAWVDLDLKIDLANRLYVKNKMADIKFGGEIELTGDNQNKVVNGNLTALPRISKFKFKDNDFLINEGIIEFQNFPREPAYLRLSASSQIKKYDVRINANGRVNKLVIDLNSEPALSKEDILSLFTLVFTSKDRVVINQEEKATMTSVGIGSLLADQLELSEGLTSDFGIRLSVTSELQETERSDLPETREGSVLPTQSKFKSATKIGFKKQISDKGEISFSNTVGGSIDQKQEVSGEYYLNKNTSIRGTYEIFNSSNREIQSSGAISNNLGVDLIFKWSYK